MSDNRDQRYISIARACLKAINDTAHTPEEREQNIQRVYDAIDEAFEQQLSEYREDLRNLTTVLERIADEGTSADRARQIARAALDARTEKTDDEPLH